MTAQHGTDLSLPFGLPPWVWMGVSTFVAFVLGFVVMVEGVYRFHSPPSPRLPTGLQQEAVPVAELSPPVSLPMASGPLPPGTLLDQQGTAPALPQPPKWIVQHDLPAFDSPSEVFAPSKVARAEQEAVLPPPPNGRGASSALGQGSSGRSEHVSSQPDETLALPELPPREQVAVWRRQNAWVILLVRYGYEQEAIAERTWQRLRDKVPAGLRLVRVESRDHREWLLLLGAFPTQEAAQAAAQRLPSDLIVRRPHLQVVAVRRLF